MASKMAAKSLNRLLVLALGGDLWTFFLQSKTLYFLVLHPKSFRKSLGNTSGLSTLFLQRPFYVFQNSPLDENAINEFLSNNSTKNTNLLITLVYFSSSDVNDKIYKCLNTFKSGLSTKILSFYQFFSKKHFEFESNQIFKDPSFIHFYTQDVQNWSKMSLVRPHWGTTSIFMFALSIYLQWG